MAEMMGHHYSTVNNVITEFYESGRTKNCFFYGDKTKNEKEVTDMEEIPDLVDITKKLELEEIKMSKLDHMMMATRPAQLMLNQEQMHKNDHAIFSKFPLSHAKMLEKV